MWNKCIVGLTLNQIYVLGSNGEIGCATWRSILSASGNIYLLDLFTSEIQFRIIEMYETISTT